MGNKQPKIIKVRELLTNGNLKIPSYQRPYKWTTKNVNQLIDDILIHKEKSEYRLGTLVIHNHFHGKDNSGVLWLGTQENGAYRFNGTAFERFIK